MPHHMIQYHILKYCHMILYSGFLYHDNMHFMVYHNYDITNDTILYSIVGYNIVSKIVISIVSYNTV